MSVKNCTHLFDDGHRCGSPALRGERHCYYHHPRRLPVADPYARRACRGFRLPAPRDRSEMNAALGQLIERIAANQLDVHRAGLLLYSLQLAGQNLPWGLNPLPPTHSPGPAPQPELQPRRRNRRASASTARGGTT